MEGRMQRWAWQLFFNIHKHLFFPNSRLVAIRGKNSFLKIIYINNVCVWNWKKWRFQNSAKGQLEEKMRQGASFFSFSLGHHASGEVLPFLLSFSSSRSLASAKSHPKWVACMDQERVSPRVLNPTSALLPHGSSSPPLRLATWSASSPRRVLLLLKLVSSCVTLTVLARSSLSPAARSSEFWRPMVFSSLFFFSRHLPPRPAFGLWRKYICYSWKAWWDISTKISEAKHMFLDVLLFCSICWFACFFFPFQVSPLSCPRICTTW